MSHVATSPRIRSERWRLPYRGLGGVPTAAWLCAVVACINAAAWSIITPPFQVPDEPEHVAYVKVLGEDGKLPTADGRFSNEEAVALRDTRLQAVAEQPERQTISSRAQEIKLQRDLLLNRGSAGVASGYAGVAASQPPLYYVLQTIPFSLSAGSTLLDRIELMRLLSTLMAGLTVLFTFLFVRETLPRIPWAWTVGGLGVALVPLLGFTSGAVSPDSMLYAVTAATFYGLARSFRCGLTRRRAIFLGIVIATGLLTKLNFVGLVPGALVGLVVLSSQAARKQGRRAYVSLAYALAIAISPVVVYVAAHVASGAAPLGIVSRVLGSTHGDLLSELSYIWQLYMPRLPGMHADFAGIFTARQIWFNAYVGQYGWLDTTFPERVYEFALVPAALIIGSSARAVLADRRVLWPRAGELTVYCGMCVGLLVLIGADSYSVFPGVGAEYGQARYLLPLLPLFGVVLALAARGVPRRWGPSAGAVIVMLFLFHDIFSQLQVVARFYG